MKILVITANVSGNSTNTVVPQTVLGVEFIQLNNSNFPVRTNAMHPRLQGKIPKMLAWELYPDYDYYIWIDSAFSFLRTDSVQWFLDQLGDKQAAFFTHPYRKSIKEEVDFVVNNMGNNDQYLIDRYRNENMTDQVNTYLKDDQYIDNVLISAGAFIYSADIVRNRENNVMKEWFYQNCLWSVQDQLSLPYVLQKYNIDYNIINKNIFKCLSTK